MVLISPIRPYIPIDPEEFCTNPYDIISTLRMRERKDIRQATEEYFSLARSVAEMKGKFSSKILDVKHESLIENPKKELKRICDFLGLEATEGYLQDCASIIYKKPHKSRADAPWNPELIKEIDERMKEEPLDHQLERAGPVEDLR